MNDEYMNMLQAYAPEPDEEDYDELGGEEGYQVPKDALYSQSTLSDNSPRKSGKSVAGYDDYLNLKKRFITSRKQGMKIHIDPLPKAQPRVGELVNTVDYPRYLSGGE